jgi:prephenate dehydrogenase
MARTVAILGTGLIGASLGLALGTADPETAPLGKCHIIGYDHDRSQLRTARGRLALDAEARSAVEAVKEADIVVLATPVQTIPDVMREIAPHLRYRTLVTDVCSTKAAVMQWAKELLPTSVSFVGGHPMAGRERAGADHAELDLFRGSIYCLCPALSAQAEAVDMATALVESVGAKPYYIDPEEHDAYVAGTSHLPFLLSIALAGTTMRSSAWREMQLLAASGFRDISRLAAGDPVMHRDICMTNKSSLHHWINETIRTLVEMRSLIDTDDHEGLLELFALAKSQRDAWMLQTPHLRPGEGEQMSKEDLGGNTITQLFLGNPNNLRKRKKD